jgi:hypothetical protein
LNYLRLLSGEVCDATIIDAQDPRQSGFFGVVPDATLETLAPPEYRREIRNLSVVANRASYSMSAMAIYHQLRRRTTNFRFIDKREGLLQRTTIAEGMLFTYLVFSPRYRGFSQWTC